MKSGVFFTFFRPSAYNVITHSHRQAPSNRSWLRRVTYENLRRNNNRRFGRRDSRKVFALRTASALRFRTRSPLRQPLPLRQTVPPVRKAEEKTVRRLLLQIFAGLRPILISQTPEIITAGRQNDCLPAFIIAI